MSLSILLVDDDPLLLRTASRLLALEGYAVVTAGDGAHALEVLERQPVQCIVSDLHMPHVDGLELLRNVRQRDSNLPFVLLSGAVEVDDVALALEYGLTALLLKPVDARALARTLHRVVTRQDRRQILAQLDQTVRGAAFHHLSLEALEEAVRDALASAEIHFQPIVDVPAGRILGWEALARPRHPVLSNPLALLQAAELCGQSRPVERRLQTLAARRFLDTEGLLGQRLFLNCSIGALLDLARSPSFWLPALAGRLVLEITEREALPPHGVIADATRILRSHRAAIAVDDLGAGFSGLMSLIELEPEFIKLDLALTRTLARSEAARQLVGHLREDAHRRGGFVIAEGVETAAESAICSALGVGLQQGYWFARPAHALSFELAGRIP